MHVSFGLDVTCKSCVAKIIPLEVSHSSRPENTPWTKTLLQF